MNISDGSINVQENFQVVISPPHGWKLPSFKDIYEYRELIWFLAWRDIKSRYKQMALGVGWALITPLINAVIYSLLLGSVARLPSDGVPYFLFSFIGTTAWSYFGKALQGASSSLISGAGILSKVYFPRLVMTLSSILSSLVDSSISLALLAVFMVVFQVMPGWNVLLLPVFILLALLTALGAGAWLTALTVQYRDVAQGMGILVSLWMYASPVVYSPEIIQPGLLRLIYWLNPVSVIVQGFRWCLVGASLPPLPMIVVSVVIILLMLFSGLIYFQRVEQTFIDLV